MPDSFPALSIDLSVISGWTVALVYLGIELIAIAAAIDAVLRTRTPQGAIAWLITLLLMPLIALPCYWVFGRRKFHGYLRAHHQGQRWPHPHHPLEPEHHTAPNADLATLQRLTQQPFTKGNQVDLLIDGSASFEALFAIIDGAQHYVLCQYYLLRDDDLGQRFAQTLIGASQRGVRVYLLFDEIGSFGLSSRYLEQMQQAGVDVSGFRTTKGRRNRFQLNFRNHRKLTIVDGQVACLGGSNIGDEYLGRDPELSPWRDTNVRVQGPAVLSFQLAFLEDWHWATDRQPEVDWHYRGHCGPHTALALSTGPADPLDSCALMFLQLINRAQTRLWIVSPYFVPDNAVIQALQLAALRGVDVRILLPARADNRLVQWSSYAYLEETSAVGIQLYRYQKGFLHQKVLLCDDDLALIGSANLDNRSFRLNFEQALLVQHAAFNRQVSRMLEEDFRHSTPLTTATLDRAPKGFYLLVRLAHLMSPIQ